MWAGRSGRLQVEAKSQQLAREMIDHADSLGEIRKAFCKTQVEIARELGVGQVAVAQLERRSDLLLFHTAALRAGHWR